jgi:peptidyl-prolyl cis-trans isomerase C
MRAPLLLTASMTVLFSMSLLAADEPKSAAKRTSIDDLFPDKVLARGKGFEIKNSAMEEEFMAFKQSMALQNRPVPEDQRVDFEARILDRLVIISLLNARATDVDKANAKVSLEKFMAESRQQAGGDEGFERALRAQGQSVERFKEKTLARALADEVFIREVRSKVEITPEQIKKFYDENTKRFEQPETVRVSQILISTVDRVTGQPMNDELVKKQRELAEQVLQEAKKGGDFAKLVEKYSDDPNSRSKGGEYTLARGQMAPEFEATAFSLPTDQISSIVTTQFGFHIIKMLEKIPAKTIEFEKVKERVRDHLAQLEADKQMPAYVDKLKQEAGVEVLQEKYIIKNDAHPKGKS